MKKRLKIEHSPTSVNISFNDNRQPISVGSNKITCDVIGGYPAVKPDQIKILIGSDEIDEKITIDSEKNLAEAQVTFDKFDHGKKISCVVSHDNLQSDLIAEAELEVTYASTEIAIELEKLEYKTGDIVNFTVVTAASFPPAPVTCTKTIFNGTVGELKSSHETLLPVEPYGTITSNQFSFKTTNLDGNSEVTCAISGTEIFSSKKISVLTQPVFLTNKIFTIKEGENFKLNLDMIIRSNPPVSTFEWRRVQAKSPRLEILDENAQKFLILRKISREMAGEYFVEADGISGTITVDVLTPPQLFVTGETKYLLGQKLELSCKSSGDPTPNVYWTKGNERISNCSELEIPAVTRDNAGIYHCIGENSHSISEEIVEISVMYQPIVTSETGRLVAFKDDYQLLLECDVDAFPAVENVIFTNPLGEENVGIWSGNAWAHQIDIGIKSATFGKWRCGAENEVGNAELLLDVVEAGKPDKIIGLRLTNQTATSVLLKWTKGYENGYSQNFRIQLKSSKEMRKFSTFSEEIRLENLTEMENYVAIVNAVNQFGESIPVEINFNLKGIQSAELPTVYIYLICFTIMTLAIIVTVVVCNRKKELIYQTKSK